VLILGDGGLMTAALDGLGDQTLLEKCIGGEAPAWEEFVRRYRKNVEDAVRRTLYRCLGRVPSHDLENVTQDVYARLYDHGCRRLRSFHGQCPLAVWLKTLAIRMTLNYVSSEKQRGRFGGGTLDGTPLYAPPGTGDLSEAILREELSRMTELLEQLEAVERTAVKLFYFDGLSYRQMSALLGIPIQTLGSILTRARAKLRKLGDPWGGEDQGP
jgi:RNA polymerase sigma-70 factor (ECF subfamily)